jgi:hypothetical protein
MEWIRRGLRRGLRNAVASRGNTIIVSLTILTHTQVVLLGTGLPPPDPDRSVPATAIVVNDTAYLVDAGPGVVRRTKAAMDRGIQALEPTKLRRHLRGHEPRSSDDRRLSWV